jgi:hypothetical protein
MLNGQIEVLFIYNLQCQARIEAKRRETQRVLIQSKHTQHIL